MAEDAGQGPGDQTTDPTRVASPTAAGWNAGSGRISGHVVPSTSGAPMARAPENDWQAARPRIFPVLRPVGTVGQPAEGGVEPAETVARSHTLPLVSAGPCGLVIAFAMCHEGYDAMVNAEHLLTWGIDAGTLAEAAGSNLADWSAEAPWTDEISGTRRLLSSDSGECHDAVRILLPEVRAALVRELTGDAPAGARVLVGLPEQQLLMAGALVPGDEEFSSLFQEFVIERSRDASEPIDRRVFELVGGELVDFAP